MKTNNIFTIFAILMATVFFASCSEESTFGDDIAEVTATPKAWEPTSKFYTSEGDTYINVNILFDDENVVKPARHQVSLTTEDTITAVGEYPFFCEEDLSEAREAKASMQYAYCYNKTNTIKVDGLVMSYMYNGKSYSLPCASTITVVGSMTEAVATEAGLANTTVYTAVANGKKLAEGTQVFLAVKPDAEDVLERIFFDWKHDAFVKNAEFANNIITGYCNNTANWYEIWSVSGKKNEKSQSFQMKHVFSYTSTKTEVDDLTAIVGKSFDFVNGEVKAVGAKVAHTGSEIVGKLEYNNKSYKDSVTVCKVAAKSISVVSATEGIVKFYDNNAEDYFEVNVPLQVTTPEAKDELQSISFNWEHNAFVKNATFANNVITGLCNNIASWHENWSVSGKKNEKSQSFQIKHVFSYTSTKTEVDDLTAIVGKSFDFVNGEVKAVGAKVAHTGSEIVGKLEYNNKSYKDSVTVCKVAAKSISVVSATEGIVKFYDNNAEDYFEVNVPLQVTEKVKLISQVENFVHDAYRKAATFANNVITVICDNHMDVTKTYSDNTTDEDKVNYTVSNLYDITMPKFILNYSESLVGVSINFDKGIAKVLGQNVVVKHRSMNVSDIIYDNKNYTNDSRRPNCLPTAKTITFVSSEEAIISFEDEGEIVAEAKVPVSVKVAINFDGVLVKGWATDSYIDGASGVASREGTYFHFVVSKNGTYTMYSAKVKDNIAVTDFTATSVSEAFVSKLNNDNPAAFTGKSVASYTIGYIDNVEKYKENSYIIDYMLQNGKLDRTVGFTGGAIKEGYRYPIRGTWAEDTIIVEGTEFYITGSQN